MKKEKYKIILEFEALPKNCSECPLYESNFYEEDETWFGDGITHYCPYGGSTWGCVVERPENCPIGKTIALRTEEQQLNQVLSKTQFKYKVKPDLFKNWIKENDLALGDAIERVNNPQSYYDLLDVAEVCDYNPG